MVITYHGQYEKLLYDQISIFKDSCEYQYDTLECTCIINDNTEAKNYCIIR